MEAKASGLPQNLGLIPSRPASTARQSQNPLSPEEQDFLAGLDLSRLGDERRLEGLLNQKVGNGLRAFVDIHLPKLRHEVDWHEPKDASFDLVQRVKRRGTEDSLKEALLGDWSAQQLKDWKPTAQPFNDADLSKLKELRTNRSSEMSGANHRALMDLTLKAHGHELQDFASEHFPDLEPRVAWEKPPVQSAFELVDVAERRGQTGRLVAQLHDEQFPSSASLEAAPPQASTYSNPQGTLTCF